MTLPFVGNKPEGMHTRCGPRGPVLRAQQESINPQHSTISEDQPIPTNSAPALDNHQPNECKNGATSVQPCADFIPFPSLDPEGDASRPQQRERMAQQDAGCAEMSELVPAEQKMDGAARVDDHQPLTNDIQPAHRTIAQRASMTINHHQSAINDEPEYLYPCPSDPELIDKWCHDHRHLNRGQHAHLALPGFLPVHKSPKQQPLDSDSKDQCKNGATSRGEPSLQFAPESGAVVVQACEATQPKSGATCPDADCGAGSEPHSHIRAAAQPELAQSASMTINHQQSTINKPPPPLIEPLFKHRVLTEDLGRELRRHFVRAR